MLEIPFVPDTNVREALEKAFDQEKSSGGTFDFAIQYFGYFGSVYGGYQVIMIDGLYDNPNDNSDYWKFIVNGNDAIVGIDSYMVNAGDIIEFDYTSYVPNSSNNILLNAKHSYYHKTN